jgi:hypothetical protein
MNYPAQGCRWCLSHNVLTLSKQNNARALNFVTSSIWKCSTEWRMSFGWFHHSKESVKLIFWTCPSSIFEWNYNVWTWSEASSTRGANSWDFCHFFLPEDGRWSSFWNIISLTYRWWTKYKKKIQIITHHCQNPSDFIHSKQAWISARAFSMAFNQ